VKATHASTATCTEYPLTALPADHRRHRTAGRIIPQLELPRH
jgi:hypothetical protein